MALMASLDSGISSLRSFARGMEVIGDNIANINTIAFNGSRADYTDAFTNVLRNAAASPGGNNPGSNQTVQQVGSGVSISSISTDFTQGSLQSTGKKTDFAIVGDGFFKVNNSTSQVSYATRTGNFRIDDRNYLVTQDGNRLQGFVYDAASLPTYTATLNSSNEVVFTKNPPASNATGNIGDINTYKSFSVGAGITNNTGTSTDDAVNAAAPKLESFEISPSGDITYLMSNGDSFKAGKVLLLKFSDPQSLVREGGGLYSGFAAAGVAAFDLTNGSPSTNGLGSLKSNTLELSNVDLTQQFANVITTQRSFQAGARVISVSDEILNEVVNLKR